MKLSDFSSDMLLDAYQKAYKELKLTPFKCHWIFSIRDILIARGVDVDKLNTTLLEVYKAHKTTKGKLR